MPRKIRYKDYYFIDIVKSKKKNKKYDAIFENIQTKKKKIISFGANGYSDFTKHRNKDRKERYLARHRKGEKWNDLMTPGALSRWILWNKLTLKASIADYRKRLKK